MDKIIIELQGNIGVGKTTFLEKVKDSDFFKDNSIFVPEPINVWKSILDENGKNLLEVFYNDMDRWAYTFQNGAYITKMMDVIESINKDKKYIFLDRSVETDMNVFAKMLYENSKKINELEWNLYNKWNNFYEKYVIKDCKKIIVYLRCDPEVAYKRIQIRGRKEEKNIKIEYLNLLNIYHEDWINKEIKNNSKVLIFDCNDDFDEDIYSNKINEIIGFINE